MRYEIIRMERMDQSLLLSVLLKYFSNLKFADLGATAFFRKSEYHIMNLLCDAEDQVSFLDVHRE